MSLPLKLTPNTGLSNNDTLLVALFIAAILHVVIVLGVNFAPPKPEHFSRSIDVTLVNTPSPKAPKDAKFLAPENQLGAGQHNQNPVPPEQRLPGLGDQAQFKPAKKQPQQPLSTIPISHKLLTQKKSAQRVMPAQKSTPVPKPEEQKQAPTHHLTPELLQQQLAQLGAEIRQNQQSSEDSQIKFISDVSTHKYIAAQYLKDWENKVERIGNLNYPEVAAKKNFSGSLMMNVMINADGTIHHISIVRSSGNTALDDAAKQIVRMSAPFAPLPLDLQKELNPKILGITRIWKFSDESMTAR